MNLDLQVYGPGHIESFLLNYELLVRDLAEVAADWPTFDSQEQSDHRTELMQVWGNRKVLGYLFRAERLSVSQQARLAKLDRLLLEQASLMEQCYGLDLSRLLAIFRWGTPLANSSFPVRVEVDPASLDRMATALTDIETVNV
jgi:hypothetical protein